MSGPRVHGTWECPTCGTPHNVLPDDSGVYECDNPCIELSEAKKIDAQDTAELVEAVDKYLDAQNTLRYWDDDDEGSHDHYKAQVREDRALDALRGVLARHRGEP